MPHVHRFYVPPDTDTDDTFALTSEEAHHAFRVARVHAGDIVFLIDGQGHEFTACVETADRHEVSVSIQSARHEPPQAVPVTLAQAWLNKERNIEDIVRRVTELGAAAVHFFKAEHSERPPRENAKWQRIAIESCKQSGRLWLPRFEVFSDINEALQKSEGIALLATKDLPHTPLRDAVRDATAVTIVIGPEGDLTSTELAQAATRNAIPVSLGHVTYRSEIAAGLAISLVQYELGALGA